MYKIDDRYSQIINNIFFKRCNSTLNKDSYKVAFNSKKFQKNNQAVFSFDSTYPHLKSDYHLFYLSHCLESKGPLNYDLSQWPATVSKHTPGPINGIGSPRSSQVVHGYPVKYPVAAYRTMLLIRQSMKLCIPGIQQLHRLHFPNHWRFP